MPSPMEALPTAAVFVGRVSEKRRGARVFAANDANAGVRPAVGFRAPPVGIATARALIRKPARGFGGVCGGVSEKRARRALYERGASACPRGILPPASMLLPPQGKGAALVGFATARAF